MAAAMAAAHGAGGGGHRDLPFNSRHVRASLDSMEGYRPRRASALLEDIAEVLPPPSEWLRDIQVKKLSQKGKWEERMFVVTQEKTLVARHGRVLETIPLVEIKQVTSVEPRDPQNTLSEVGKQSPLQVSQEGDLHRGTSFPSLTHASSWKEDSNWKKSKIVKMVSWASHHRIAHLEEDMGLESSKLCFEILTRTGGEFSGRSFIFMCEASSQKADLMTFLSKQIAVAARRHRNKGIYRRWQQKTRKVYESFPFQMCVALLIIAAFVIQVWESETFPEEGTTARSVIDSTDFMLTTIFSIELLINMFSHWFIRFFKDPWNLFDMAIVGVSIVSLMLSSVPGLGALRLMRTFRVLRLFGRLQSFRRIISALGAALIPVTTAFIIVLLMISVFAIMGVFLFQTKAPEFFGSFSASFFTMFTISTVDGWVDVVYVAAPGTHDWGKLYFILYIIVLVWTLLPVVVAVLLDKFTEVMAKDKDRQRRARLPAFKPVTSSVLDPILKTLTDFESDDNLSKRIRLLFEALDAEGNNSLTFSNLTESLHTLRLGKSVYISEVHRETKHEKSPSQSKLQEEDFQELTQDGALCDASGGLSGDAFEQVVRAELRDYLQRGLAEELLKCEENSVSASILSSLKLLLLSDRFANSRYAKMPDGVRGNQDDGDGVFPVDTVGSFVSHRNGSGADVSHRNGSGAFGSPPAKLRLPPRYSPVPFGPTSLRKLEPCSATTSGEDGAEASLPGQVSEGADSTSREDKIWDEEMPQTNIPVVPVSADPVSVEKAPIVLDEPEKKLELGRGGNAEESEQDRREMRALSQTMKQMEALLQNMLQGQQRLETKVNKLDGELGRLSQSHSQITQTVAEVQKVSAAVTEIQRQQAAAVTPVTPAAGIFGERTCDICQDEAAKKIVGRASVCQLCASLLTYGHEP